MGEKLTCPGCDSHTSGVLFAVRNDEPCPYCGLSARAIVEVTATQMLKADEGLKERAAKLMIENDKLSTEVGNLRRIIRDVKYLVAADAP